MFAACTAPCNCSTIWALDLATGTASQVAADGLAAWYLPTGHLAFVRRDRHLMVVPFDLMSFSARGTPVALLDSVSTEGPIPYLAVSGRELFYLRDDSVMMAVPVTPLVAVENWFEEIRTRLAP